MQKLFFLLLGLQTATHSMEGESKTPVTASVICKSISSKELGMQELKEGDHFRDLKPEEARKFVRHHLVLKRDWVINRLDGKKYSFSAYTLQNNLTGSLGIYLPEKNIEKEIGGRTDEIHIEFIEAQWGYGLSILTTFINFFKNEEVFPERRYFSLENGQEKVLDDLGHKVLFYDLIGFETSHTKSCFNGYPNTNHDQNQKTWMDEMRLPSGTCKSPYMYLRRSEL